MKKYCEKCGLELPADHKKQYCVSPKHACWCSDALNQWRLKNKIVTYADLRKAFMGSIDQHLVIHS